MTVLSILIALAIVALLIFASYQFVPFHPKAQMLCKLWYRVEHPKDNKTKDFHFTPVTSSTR